MNTAKMVEKNVWNKIYLVVLVTLLGLGQLQRVAVTSEISFYLHDVWILGWMMMNGITKRRMIWGKLGELWRRIWRRKSIIIALGILGVVFILGWVGAIARGDWQLQSLFYLFRMVTYLSFGLMIWILKPVEKEWYGRLFLLMNGIWLMLGWGQMIFLPDTSFMRELGWDDHRNRMIGSWFDPAFLGLAVTWLLLILAMSEKKIGKAAKIILMILAAGALVLTYSRASYLALVAGVITWFILLIVKRKNAIKKMRSAGWKIASGGTLIIGGSIILLAVVSKPEAGLSNDLLRTRTLEIRWKETQTYLSEMSPSEILVGRGVYISREYDPVWLKEINREVKLTANFGDNMFLTGVGFVGVIGGVTLLYLLGVSLVWIYRRKPILLPLMVAWLIHAQFCASLLQPFIVLNMIWIWWVVWLGIKSSRID